MVRNITLAAAALIGLSGLAAAPAAHAAVFDFLAEANKLEKGYQPYSLTRDGITVTARGYNGAMQVFAYMDAGDAGLGVCKVLTASKQCNPSSDDNVTSGERLNLTFSTAVTISTLSFRDENHGLRFDSTDRIDLKVDGVQLSDIQLPVSGGVYARTLTGTSFDFIFDNEQFYISSVTAQAVPEPATAMLLGAGMLGLAAARRRRT